MTDRDLLKMLTEAAERFVDKAPNQKRLEAERTALLDAIRQSQLALSLHPKKAKNTGDASARVRPPSPSRSRRSRRPSDQR